MILMRFLEVLCTMISLSFQQLLLNQSPNDNGWLFDTTFVVSLQVRHAFMARDHVCQSSSNCFLNRVPVLVAIDNINLWDHKIAEHMGYRSPDGEVLEHYQHSFVDALSGLLKKGQVLREFICVTNIVRTALVVGLYICLCDTYWAIFELVPAKKNIQFRTYQLTRKKSVGWVGGLGCGCARVSVAVDWCLFSGYNVRTRANQTNARSGTNCNMDGSWSNI